MPHDNHLCRNCAAKYGAHRASDAACPPPRVAFPKWPSTIDDEAKAGALYDKRLAAYWKASESTFSPKV